jgi:hypothetical protein
MVADPIDFAARRQVMMGNEAKQKAPRLYQSAHFLQVDMDVLELVHGDWKAACLFAKILDMQQQSPDGWVYHSWPQWEEQHFSRAEVERCVPLLVPLGLQVKVCDYKGRLTRHYHVEIEEFKQIIIPQQEVHKQANREKSPQVNPAVTDNHPVEKLQGAEKSHGVENLQGPCENVTADPAEKLQGLQGRSDLVIRSTETDQEGADVSDDNAQVKPTPSVSSSPPAPVDPNDALLMKRAEKVAQALQQAIARFAEDSHMARASPSEVREWVPPIRDMLEKEKRNPKEIKRVLDELHEASDFLKGCYIAYHANPGEVFKEQFDELKHKNKEKSGMTQSTKPKYRNL